MPTIKGCGSPAFRFFSLASRSGAELENRVVLKLDIDLHPHRIVATDVDGVDEPLVTEMTESVVVDVGASE